jgi:hypothetical protein
MRKLDRDALIRESERARRLRPTSDVDPSVGELWSIRPYITAPQSGNIVEHSDVPVAVAILARRGSICEVVPVSFETDLAGDEDLVIQDAELFGRPFMLEGWLRLPVTRGALGRRFAVLTDEMRGQLLERAAAILDTEAPDLPLEDPRRAYREDERLRVLFASAGVDEQIEAAEPRSTEAVREVLALKREQVERVPAPTFGRPAAVGGER